MAELNERFQDKATEHRLYAAIRTYRVRRVVAPYECTDDEGKIYEGHSGGDMQVATSQEPGPIEELTDGPWLGNVTELDTRCRWRTSWKRFWPEGRHGSESATEWNARIWGDAPESWRVFVNLVHAAVDALGDELREYLADAALTKGLDAEPMWLLGLSKMVGTRPDADPSWTTLLSRKACVSDLDGQNLFTLSAELVVTLGDDGRQIESCRATEANASAKTHTRWATKQQIADIAGTTRRAVENWDLIPFSRTKKGNLYDMDKYSPLIAQKSGMTSEEILEKWQEVRGESLSGTEASKARTRKVKPVQQSGKATEQTTYQVVDQITGRVIAGGFSSLAQANNHITVELNGNETCYGVKACPAPE